MYGAWSASTRIVISSGSEENTFELIKRLLSIDVFSDKKIRIMPDVHAGAGCVIGFTSDESPMVYKPASEIIANIGDTVTIDTIIRPIFNFKASK